MQRRLVLDSNVWLDWLVFGDAAVMPIRTDVEQGRSEVIIDGPCMAELGRVLACPLQRWTLDAAGMRRALAECARHARWVATAPAAALPRCPDADDQKFLELAAGCGAHALITRDRALLRMARHRLPFHIVTPAHYEALARVESTA